jgi:hypothetical protein
MAISVHCQQCPAKFAVKDRFAGKLIRCPECKEDIIVPVPAAVTGRGKAAAAKPLPVPREIRVPQPPANEQDNGYGLGKKLQTIAFLVGGFALLILGRFAYRYGFEAAASAQAQGPGYMILVIGLVLIVVGTLTFLWGCVTYTEGKGYPRALGLLGLLGPCGLPIMWLVMLVGGKRKRSA